MGDHLSVIFAGLDVSLAVYLCINCSFFYIYSHTCTPYRRLFATTHRNIFHFLSRDAMHGVRPCVRLSVTIVDSIKTNIFFTVGSHTILVFAHRTAWQYSDGNPPPKRGVKNAGEVGRNRDSEPIYGFTVCCEPFQWQMQYI